VKRLALLAAASIALFSAACGGGGGVGNVPPPNNGNFSLASLKGQYTFSMSGTDLSGGAISRVGSFFADGTGKITSAMEDVLDEGAALNTVAFGSASTYTIDSSGHGQITFTQSNNSGNALILNFVLTSTAGGVLTETDTNNSTSGNFTLSSGNFSQGMISGSYVFDVSGIAIGNPNDVGVSVLGQFRTNGTTIASGVLDEVDGNNPPSGPSPLTTNGGTIVLDNNANGTSFGRGTVSIASSIGTLNFVFYIVDGTHLKFLTTDAGFVISGDAFQQQAGIPTQNSSFNASFAFLIGGSDSNGPLTEAGRFTADGSGNLPPASLFMDVNSNGAIFSATNPSASTYSIDVANAGSGRGTATFDDPTGVGTITFVFYLFSPTQGFIQDNSTAVAAVADGSLQIQSAGPFSNSSVAGNYAFSLSGINLANGFEHEAIGQYVLPLPSGQNANGVLDLVELASTGQTIIPNDPITVTITFSGDGTKNGNLYTLTSQKAPATTSNFIAYFVSNDKVFLISTHGNGANLAQTVDAAVAQQQH
jgi:hypothetical protein